MTEGTIHPVLGVLHQQVDKRRISCMHLLSLGDLQEPREAADNLF
jgi:hypothetical protein